MIDVSGIDKVAFAKAVYRLSVPKGMGMLHARQGELDEAEARAIAGSSRFAMDYIFGRCCKMSMTEKEGKLFISDSWYDHTDAQFDELLGEFGIQRVHDSAHGSCCECDKCAPAKTNRSQAWETSNAAPNN